MHAPGAEDMHASCALDAPECIDLAPRHDSHTPATAPELLLWFGGLSGRREHACDLAVCRRCGTRK